MIRVSIKDLLGRKLRLLLTSLAIVMGVAMVSGTYVLTDTIDAAFNQIFTTAYSGTDAVVTGKEVFGGSQNAPSFPASTLTRIRALPGVADATGGIGDIAQYVGKDGKVLTLHGAPGLAFSVDPKADQRFNPLTLLSGSWPVGPSEVGVDKQTAKKLGVAIGGTVGLLPRGGQVRHFRVAGIVQFGHSTLGGATLAIFDLPTAQALFRKKGELDQIDVARKANVSVGTLLGQIQSVLPPHTQVRTGEQQAKKSSSDTSAALSFLRYFLLAFGGIALFVGAFVIANTLTITIAQRTREFATLRSMGASARQILGAVVVEGLVLGLVASTVGLFVGLGLAKGLDEVFKAFGADLPQAGLVFATRTVVLALVVGVLVTLVATLRPAFRATRVPPIAAVREGSILPPSRFARFSLPVALVTCAAAGALVGYGAFGHGLKTGNRLLLLAVGILGVFVGVAMLAPRVARPLASVLGRPAEAIGGVAGSLARSNAMRNPARTASTAAALMIGLALVTAVAVLAQGLRNSFEGAVKQEFHADYAITSQSTFTPTSVDSAAALRKSGVATVVAGVRAGEGRAFDKTIQVTGVEPGLSKVLRLKWERGSDASLEGLGAHGAIVDKKYASNHHLAVGSPIRLETPGGEFLDLEVRAIFSPPRGGSPLGNVTVSSTAFDSVYPNPQNLYAFALVPGGVTAANTARLEHVLASFPDAKLQTESQFITNEEQGLNLFLNLLYILLGLSIVVSLFGIVNTLVLTVFERTREIGMLRAVGMTRRQTRRMIRHESVVTALIGAALGIPIGLGLAELFDHAIGNVPFAIPGGTIVVFVVAAIFVGLVAAIFPARRASRLNVLAALQYE
ncbi:MAG: FtsX-like permease family protein [Actinobacteria bacterium]|nr:FtsX-like permease family protein [Actinomycetota bacterium]